MNPTYCTWPETSYALSLTKPGMFPAQRRVLEVFVAHAFAQGLIAGEVECSERDLASHLHAGVGSVNAAGNLLDGLVERRILRQLAKGSGTSPSIFRVWHWSYWPEEGWAIRKRTAEDRLTAFAGSLLAAQARAQSGFSARVLVRALAKSGRAFSDEIEALARVSMDTRASDLIARETPLVGASRHARYGAPPTDLLERDKSLSLEGVSEEQQQRTDELLDALKAGCAITKIWGAPVRRIAYLAAESNGRFGELVALARDPSGPATLMARLELLEQTLRRPPMKSVRKKVTYNDERPVPDFESPAVKEGFAKAKQALGRL